MFDEAFHALDVIRQSFSASGRDFVSRFWPQADERLFARDITLLFQFAKMRIQAAINRVEPFFKRREIKRAAHLQRGHEAERERAMEGGVEAVKIRGLFFLWGGNFSTAVEG